MAGYSDLVTEAMGHLLDEGYDESDAETVAERIVDSILRIAPQAIR